MLAISNICQHVYRGDFMNDFYEEEYFNVIYDKESSGHMINRNGKFEVISIENGIETYVIPFEDLDGSIGFAVMLDEPDEWGIFYGESILKEVKP